MPQFPSRSRMTKLLDGCSMKIETHSGAEHFTDILTRTQQNRLIVQDYRPLPESLEWRLGQHYYQRRGNKGFISDSIPVPFLINNDGKLSSKTAELVFSALEASERNGTLEERIFVLELGIGVGLFARFFLDRFQDLCVRSRKDYYERLCYVAADRSEKMLLDACRHGIFSNHPGRYLLRIIDASEPFVALNGDLAFDGCSGAPIRAVFLNYILDCLPAAILQINDRDVRQLYIRTYLARAVDLHHHTHLSADEVVRLANSDDHRVLDELAPLYGLFASEHDYREVDPGELPFGEVAVKLANGRGRYILHNYGALECLSRLSSVIREDGFILVNEYGHTKLEKTQEGFEPQRFSGASAVGLDFFLISECLRGSGILDSVEPVEDCKNIFSRLLVKVAGAEVIARFHDFFGKIPSEKAQEPVLKARAYHEQGRHELTISSYQRALQDEPWNWALMSEVARFLSVALRDPAAGLALNRAALTLNPACSSGLWDDLGDTLHLLNRRGEAQQAFFRALRVNPEDVRAYYSLAVCYFFDRDFPKALRAIADGLAFDRSGAYRRKLLQLQNDILERLTRLHQFESHLQVDRISRA
jgi:tetratricopeptide (TPR) repeat protein